VRICALVFLTALALACSRPPPDATPEGALREWIDKMGAERDGPRQEGSARAAYALLSAGTHEKLEKRAERSSRSEGHHVEPWDVLAPGRFALKFRPTHLTSTVSGDTATVRVTGDAPEDLAVMHCAREGKAWRVVLDLPELMELPHRQEN
jgi:hypothetical protein